MFLDPLSTSFCTYIFIYVHVYTNAITCSVSSNSLQPQGLVVKNLPATARDIRDVSLIPGEGNDNPLQHPCLEIHVQTSLAGYGPYGPKELDRIERRTHTHTLNLKWEIIHSIIYFGFPYSSDGKESTCNAGDLGLILGSGRSPGEGNGNALQYSCLENPMDSRAWWATVHGVTKDQTRLGD